MTNEICVEGPMYGGAPYPAFNEKAINESKFEYKCRFKEYLAKIQNGVGYVEWTSYNANKPTKKWKSEIARAFAANGQPSGSLVHCKFGSRYNPMVEFDIVIS